MPGRPVHWMPGSWRLAPADVSIHSGPTGLSSQAARLVADDGVLADNHLPGDGSARCPGRVFPSASMEELVRPDG